MLKSRDGEIPLRWRTNSMGYTKAEVFSEVWFNTFLLIFQILWHLAMAFALTFISKSINTEHTKIDYYALVKVFWHKLKDSLNTGTELLLFIHHEWINFHDDFIHSTHSTKWTSLTTCACFFCYFSFGLVLLCRSAVLQGLQLSPRKREKKGEKVEHSLSTEKAKTRAKSDPKKRERCTNQRARFHLTAL